MLNIIKCFFLSTEAIWFSRLSSHVVLLVRVSQKTDGMLTQGSWEEFKEEIICNRLGSV